MIDRPVYQFVDTNILVYAHDRSAGDKRDTAQALMHTLWESQLGCLSIQVLQEFYVTVTRKVTKPLSPEYAIQIITDLGRWRIHSPAVEDIQGAVDIQVRYGLSFWDAMIVRSATRLGCQMLWSEDFNAGQRYDNLLVLNPFDHS